MKALLLFQFVFFAIIVPVYSQDSITRTIEVIGYAQVDVTPNEIYYLVEISDKREGKELIKLETIEQQFEELIDRYGIENERIRLVNSDSRKFQYRRKKDEIQRSKSFEIKFLAIDELDRFGEDLRQIEIEKAGITRVDHSELLKIESDLKVAAIKNAKERAKILLEAIDEEIDLVLEITELDENNFRQYIEQAYYQLGSIQQRVESGYLSSYSTTAENVEFKAVRLATTIKTRFSIR